MDRVASGHPGLRHAKLDRRHLRAAAPQQVAQPSAPPCATTRAAPVVACPLDLSVTECARWLRAARHPDLLLVRASAKVQCANRECKELGGVRGSPAGKPRGGGIGMAGPPHEHLSAAPCELRTSPGRACSNLYLNQLLHCRMEPSRNTSKWAHGNEDVEATH